MNITLEDRQNFQVQQGHMIMAFKLTPEYQLIKNTFEATAYAHKKERQRVMKSVPSRELTFYHDGFSDGIDWCLEALDRIVIDAEEIKESKEAQRRAEED